jgi:sucrose-6-phosphate hydrolase SacC (GH32 family)
MEMVRPAVIALTLWSLSGCLSGATDVDATAPPPAPWRAFSVAGLAPRYHLNNGAHFQNDPSGPIFLEVNGTLQWFVFPDQNTPDAQGLSRVFTSLDGVHWVRRDTSITWQYTGGVAVTPDGIARAIHNTGYVVCNTTADPWLADWSKAQHVPPCGPSCAKKGGGAPPLSHTAARPDIFRIGDPARPFQFHGEHYLVMGVGTNGSRSDGSAGGMRGETWLYKARNKELTSWSYVSVLFSTNVSAGHWWSQPTNMLECPDMFALGDKWVLLVSQIMQGGTYKGGGNTHYNQWYVGDFDGAVFTPTSQGVLDWGLMAAAKTITDVANNASSRRVLLGWLNAFDRQGSAEGDAANSTSTASELGSSVLWPAYETYASQVLPRELSLCSDGTLCISPIAELSALRIASTAFHATNPAATRCLSTVRGRQLELEAVLQAAEGASVSGVTVLGSPDGEEFTVVGVNATHLVVDQRHSTLRPDCRSCVSQSKTAPWWSKAAFVLNHTVRSAPLPTAPQEKGTQHRLRAYLDGNTLEVFLNGRLAITTIAFPTRSDSTCVGIVGGVASLKAWRLKDAPTTGVPPMPPT